MAPDPPVLRGSLAPCDLCHHRIFPSTAPEHPCRAEHCGEQNCNVATIQGVHTPSPRFGCCCKGILQMK